MNYEKFDLEVGMKAEIVIVAEMHLINAKSHFLHKLTFISVDINFIIEQIPAILKLLLSMRFHPQGMLSIDKSFNFVSSPQ